MIRKNKKTLILTSLLTLLPIFVGLLLWDKLPEKFATHWGMDGQPDGWSSLPFAVFVPPLIMLAVQWLCVLVTAKDPGNKNRNKKMQKLVLWIIPVISNLSSGLMYALALGVTFSISNFMVVFLGLMFVVMGNYLPKCRQNSTIGIKVPWAYTSEENWNATHRFGGKLWVIGGLVIALCGLIPGEFGMYIMLIAIFVLAFLPMIYSYCYYRKQKASGDALVSMPPMFGRSGKLTAALLILILLFVLAVLFTGGIHIRFGEDAFTIEASYYDDLTVEYDAIDSIDYREGNVSGTRIFGFGSLRLLMGNFENEEFGAYTRYTYYNPDTCIVLTVGDKTLVISGETVEETNTIFVELSAKIN